MNNEKIETNDKNKKAVKIEVEVPQGKRAEWVGGVLTLVDDAPRDVTERIKTFEDACRELGIEAGKWIDDRAGLGLEPDVVAYLKLRIICAALNEGWKPKFTEGEWRYYPWFWLYTQDEISDMDEQKTQGRHLISTGDYETGYAGLAYVRSNNSPSCAFAYFGSRLCLKNEALAVYCGKQFIDIWADFLLPRK